MGKHGIDKTYLIQKQITKMRSSKIFKTVVFMPKFDQKKTNRSPLFHKIWFVKT